MGDATQLGESLVAFSDRGVAFINPPFVFLMKLFKPETRPISFHGNRIPFGAKINQPGA